MLKASYRTYWFRELVSCDFAQKRLRLNTEIGICDYSAKVTIVITLSCLPFSNITSFPCFFVKRLKSNRFSSLCFKISLETKFSHDPKAETTFSRKHATKLKLIINYKRGNVVFRTVKVSVKDYRNMRNNSKIIVIDLCAVIIQSYLSIWKFVTWL